MNNNDYQSNKYGNQGANKNPNKGNQGRPDVKGNKINPSQKGGMGSPCGQPDKSGHGGKGGAGCAGK